MQFKNATDFAYVSAATPLPVSLTGTIPATITDDTTTNATMYPTWVTAATGNLPIKVSSTKLSWNPSTAAFGIGTNAPARTLEVRNDASGAQLSLYRADKTAAFIAGLEIALNDSADARKVYALIAAAIDTNTAGAEDGSLSLRVKVAGTTTEIVNINKSGPTVCSSVATPAAGATNARLLFGTTAGFGIYYGSNAPTVSAAQGSLYLRSDGSSGSTRLYVNTNGTTGWTNFTSAT